MSSELKLAVILATPLVLFVGSIAWIVYDWLRRREKWKRYDRWLDAQIPVLLAQFDGLLSRIETARLRLDRLRQFYDDTQTDEYWEQWFADQWAEHNAPRNANGRIGRPTIDGYYYYQED